MFIFTVGENLRKINLMWHNDNDLSKTSDMRSYFQHIKCNSLSVLFFVFLIGKMG